MTSSFPKPVLDEIERNAENFLKKTPWARLLYRRALDFPTYTEILENDLLSERSDIVHMFVVADFMDDFKEKFGKGLSSAELLYGMEIWLNEHQEQYNDSAQRIIALLDEYHTFVLNELHTK